MSSARADNRASNLAFMALLCIVLAGVFGLIGYGVSLPRAAHYLIASSMFALPCAGVVFAFFAIKHS